MLNNELTLRKAALIAGFGYILMFGTPIAEFVVFNKIVDLHNGEATVKNIAAHLALFRYGILFYLVNFIGDIIAAWALYFLLKPVSPFLSMLAAWLRIIYTLLSLVALMNLLTVVQLLVSTDYSQTLNAGTLQFQVMMALHAFRDGWAFSFIFFGIYLVLIGYLAIISKFIHKIVGICLIIAGLGWLTDNIQPYFFPNKAINIGMLTGIGELVFMLWLFIKGSRLKEQN